MTQPMTAEDRISRLTDKQVAHQIATVFEQRCTGQANRAMAEIELGLLIEEKHAREAAGRWHG